LTNSGKIEDKLEFMVGQNESILEK
jgi:hypothetical protein